MKSGIIIMMLLNSGSGLGNFSLRDLQHSDRSGNYKVASGICAAYLQQVKHFGRHPGFEHVCSQYRIY